MAITDGKLGAKAHNHNESLFDTVEGAMDRHCKECSFRLSQRLLHLRYTSQYVGRVHHLQVRPMHLPGSDSYPLHEASAVMETPYLPIPFHVALTLKEAS